MDGEIFQQINSFCK